MKKDLWLRLQSYNFEHLVPTHLWDHVTAVFGGTDASTKAFADKLSRKLHCSTSFALRAIEEYKKFAYLGQVSGFGVTPSKVIDQVWHEHLLFSRAYRHFCSEVLRGDFDHNPELVPVENETGIFQAQYVETIALYKREFNSEPPADIWSVPKFNSTDINQFVDYKPREKTVSRTTSSFGSDDPPLYTFFSGSDGIFSQAHTHHFHGFGGGNSGGAGASDTCDQPTDRSAHTESSGDSHSSTTDHGGDGGQSGDSGSSCSGSSSCSSSCGGSGCGGS